MLYTHKLSFDLNKQGPRQRITVAHGSADSIAVELTLYDGGDRWAIPAGTSCVIRYMKANGNGGVYHVLDDGTNAWSLKENKVRVMLISSAMDIPGLTDVSVALIHNGRTLCLFGFDVHVDCNLIFPDTDTGDVLDFHSLAEINTALAALQMKTDTDETLSLEDRPADAAATGAAIQEVSQNKISKSGDDVSGWLNFTGTTQGIKWKTADGTEFQIRPYTSGNVLQIVRVDTDGKSHATMNVSNEGQVTFGEKALTIGSGGTGGMTATAARENLGITPGNIGALAEKWGFVSAAANGVMTNAQVISTSEADGQYNMPKLVTKGTTSGIPNDCEMGVRTVQWHSANCILTKIEGIATDGTAGIWYNLYNGSSWKVWKRVDLVLESTTAPGCYYRYCNSVIEWMNPPMILGTEYKTVERWQGKAVYTKLVSCGIIPADGQKTVAHGAMATAVIRCIACSDDGTSLPYTFFPTQIDVMATTTEVQIFAQNRTAEGGMAYVQIWYVKE